MDTQVMAEARETHKRMNMCTHWWKSRYTRRMLERVGDTQACITQPCGGCRCISCDSYLYMFIRESYYSLESISYCWSMLLAHRLECYSGHSPAPKVLSYIYKSLVFVWHSVLPRFAHWVSLLFRLTPVQFSFSPHIPDRFSFIILWLVSNVMPFICSPGVEPHRIEYSISIISKPVIVKGIWLTASSCCSYHVCSSAYRMIFSSFLWLASPSLSLLFCLSFSVSLSLCLLHVLSSYNFRSTTTRLTTRVAALFSHWSIWSDRGARVWMTSSRAY